MWKRIIEILFSSDEHKTTMVSTTLDLLSISGPLPSPFEKETMMLLTTEAEFLQSHDHCWHLRGRVVGPKDEEWVIRAMTVFSFFFFFTNLINSTCFYFSCLVLKESLNQLLTFITNEYRENKNELYWSETRDFVTETV